MFRRCFFLTLFFFSPLFAIPIQERSLDPLALQKLASAFNIPKDADVVAETQKKWLGKNREFWELDEVSFIQQYYTLNWAHKAGLFSPWRPASVFYDKAILLGMTTDAMSKSLDYLKELWRKGVRFKEVIWLTGERPLDPKVDGYLNQAKTEAQAAQVIWDEADLPQKMHTLPVTFINTPMKEVMGKLQRPSRKDTLNNWLKGDIKPCTALFVSNQPFCGYQFAVLKKLLPNDIHFDVVGYGVQNNHSAVITLYSIAMWIYEEQKIELLEG